MLTSDRVDGLKRMIANMGLTWDYSDSAICDALNSEKYPNPNPAPLVDAPFTFADLLGVLSAESAAGLKTFPHLIGLFASVGEGDRSTVLCTFQLLAAAGDITPEELADVSTILAAKVPDPDHPASLSWGQVTLGRPVTTADIRLARHS